MRPIPPAEVARKLDSTRESVPGAEPVAAPNDSIPKVVVTPLKGDQDPLGKTNFAGKLAALPAKDLAFVSTIHESNNWWAAPSSQITPRTNHPA